MVADSLSQLLLSFLLCDVSLRVTCVFALQQLFRAHQSCLLRCT